MPVQDRPSEAAAPKATQCGYVLEHSERATAARQVGHDRQHARRGQGPFAFAYNQRDVRIAENSTQQRTSLG